MTKPPYQSVVVLTGAGISAESGIRTFRAADGLWEEHRIEDVASPEGFARDPALVHHFYNQRRHQLLHENIEPNQAHRSLADFERAFNGSFTLITQNIDDLHERAGSSNLLHMHGELLQMRCAHTETRYPWHTDSSTQSICECCSEKGLLRPDIVWFGEMPFYMDQIYQALEECDLFVAIGTSGNVYPAAGFFEVAHAAGATTVELNLEPSVSGSRFNKQYYGPATDVVPAFFNALKD